MATVPISTNIQRMVAEQSTWITWMICCDGQIAIGCREYFDIDETTEF